MTEDTPEFLILEAVAYYKYVLDLIEDGYPINIMTPEEFKKGEFDD